MVCKLFLYAMAPLISKEELYAVDFCLPDCMPLLMPAPFSTL